MDYGFIPNKQLTEGVVLQGGQVALVAKLFGVAVEERW
jgi:hypothetical protein